MNSNDVLKLLIQIGATSSRNGKEDLLRQHIENPLVLKVVQLAYDPFITFGLTPPEPPQVAGSDSFDAFDKQPWAMLDGLAKREITGLAAKTAVEMEMGLLDAESAALLWRILRKDLRCGITEKTINTVLPGTVPTFDLMLSKPYEEKRIKTFPVACEPKLDGFRGMTLVSNGVAKAYSRSGLHYPQLDWAGPMIAEMIEEAHKRALSLSLSGSTAGEHFYKWLGGEKGPSAAIDAEAVSKTFADTSGDLRRKGQDARDAILHVFDAVPFEFMRATGRPEWNVPLRVRRKFAEFIAGLAPANAPVKMTEFQLAHSLEEIRAIYAGHRAAGLEGTMVKPLDGAYQKKKGHLWMKIKPEETEDLRITGWFEGKEGTKLEGKFGGFIVTRDHHGEPVEVRVGGGFSDAQREEFLALAKLDDADEAALAQHGEHLTGALGRVMQRLIEVEFHEVTPDGSLRHPRFVRFRDDKDEKLKVAA